MSSSIYIPHPEEVQDVTLPTELSPLIEAIARNVHEVWAQGRLQDGWTYGPVRDDALKQHPCLVPYEQLPECEKEYDRNTALATLRLIVKQGFRIVPC